MEIIKIPPRKFVVTMGTDYESAKKSIQDFLENQGVTTLDWYHSEVSVNQKIAIYFAIALVDKDVTVPKKTPFQFINLPEKDYVHFEMTKEQYHDVSHGIDKDYIKNVQAYVKEQGRRLDVLMVPYLAKDESLIVDMLIPLY